MSNTDTGVQFPAQDDGRRATTGTGKEILAAAVQSLDPGLAAAIRAQPNWRKNYGPHLVKLVTLALESGDETVSMVSGGLTAVHESFRFLRKGEDVTPREAMARYTAPVFETATVQGTAEPMTELQVPHRDGLLKGDRLKRKLDDWLDRGMMEPSAAAALLRLMDEPEWLDLRDLHFAMLGAGAEVGPFDVLSRHGANLIALDLDRVDIWRRLIARARGGAGRMLFPLKEALPPGADDERMAAVAGCDLLTMAPEIRTWLAGIDAPFCIGGYAYLHGPDHVRVEVAMDAIMEDLTANRDDVALAFLLTPTDVFVVPEEAARRARSDFAAAGIESLWREPLRKLSKGRLYAPNAVVDLREPGGKSYGLYDGIVPQQGPNYALAKRIQKWRALTARAAGVRVSANVAPSTATASVMMRREFAAAFAGAKHYGIDVFQPDTTNAIMAALLVHDLRNDECPANPAVALDHPLELFMDESVHGGLWRTGLQLRSVLEIAALRGLIRPGRRPT